GAAHHRLCREVHSLLRRTALAINGGARHFLGQTGGKPAGARDVASQRPDGVNATEDHVIVFVVGDVVAIHDRFQHMGTEVGTVHVAQAALAATGGAAKGVNDIGFWHNSPQMNVLPAPILLSSANANSATRIL